MESCIERGEMFIVIAEDLFVCLFAYLLALLEFSLFIDDWNMLIQNIEYWGSVFELLQFLFSLSTTWFRFLNWEYENLRIWESHF